MKSYILRRVLYALPLLLGINAFLFVLFFVFTNPDRMARIRLGSDATLEQVQDWKQRNRFDLPLFYDDGWTQVSAREFRAPSVVQMDALTPGRYRLIVRPSRGDIAARLAIASQVKLPDTLIESWRDPVEGAELPEAPKGRKWQAALTGKWSQGHDYAVEFIQNELELLNLSIGSDQAGLQVYLEKWQARSLHQSIQRSLFFEKSLSYLWFDFGVSEDGTPLRNVLLNRLLPSALIAIPTFILGVGIELSLAILLVYFRSGWVEKWGIVLSTLLMSISIMFIAIGGQWVLGKELHLFPVTGFAADQTAIRFVALPILVGVIAHMGSGVRWYRAILLEEMSRAYVQSARSFGFSEPYILVQRVVRNALAPIVNTAMGALPALLMGSVALESLFEIPGIGYFTLEAIRKQDFGALQAGVFAGSAFYIVVLLISDVIMAWVDPRVEMR